MTMPAMAPTDAELADWRAAQSAMLPEAPQLLRYQRVDARGGGFDDQWTPAPALELDATPRARRGDPTAADLRLIADRFGAGPHVVVTLRWGSTVRLGDRLDFGDALLQLVGQLAGEGPWATATRYAAVEVPRGRG